MFLSLAAAAVPFYTHDKWGGYALVIGVCGSMILWMAFVAWYNFAPNGPVKRREREGKES